MNEAFSSDNKVILSIAETESILLWLEQFSLSRPMRKINRDFSDAVLLAEIMKIYYPKLVDLHNYSPRNAVVQKLDNWITINRKVLKKLKLSVSHRTLEMLANSVAGVVERLLLAVRDKILKDEIAKVPTDKDDHSSNGSWYEACATVEDDTMVVPIRHRTGETFEIYHKKVISYDVHEQMKSRLTESEEAIEILKQKVFHLESVLKMKDQRIEDLQSQVSKKQSRSKESISKLMADKLKLITPNCSPIKSVEILGGQGDDREQPEHELE